MRQLSAHQLKLQTLMVSLSVLSMRCCLPVQLVTELDSSRQNNSELSAEYGKTVAALKAETDRANRASQEVGLNHNVLKRCAFRPALSRAELTCSSAE